jgi:hypothetical protein
MSKLHIECERLTPPKIAKMLGISQRKVLHWINTKILAAEDYSDGNIRPRWYVKRTDLEAFLATRRNCPAPKPTRRPAPVDAGVTEYF